MSKVLKWILYILVGLVALSVIAGVVFMVFGGFRYGMMGPGIRAFGPGIRIQIKVIPINITIPIQISTKLDIC